MVPKQVSGAKARPVPVQEPKVLRVISKLHKDLKALPLEVLVNHPASAKKRATNTKPKLVLVIFKAAL